MARAVTIRVELMLRRHGTPGTEQLCDLELVLNTEPNLSPKFASDRPNAAELACKE